MELAGTIVRVDILLADLEYPSILVGWILRYDVGSSTCRPCTDPIASLQHLIGPYLVILVLTIRKSSLFLEKVPTAV